jgi:Uma2 family endonuclease
VGYLGALSVSAASPSVATQRILTLDEPPGSAWNTIVMSAILEIREVRQRVSRLSVEEYHRLDEFNENGRRTELIRGIVIEKTSRSPLHSSVAKGLYDRVAAMLPAGLVLRREDTLTLADSEPEPDIAVVRGAEADFVGAHPTTAELVIEVAVSSPTLDRENASLYAEAHVEEYWIVLAPERRVEVYRRPENGRYQEMRPVGPDDLLESASVPTVRLRVADLFA